MAESIKLNGNKFIDTTGLYDTALGETQANLNANYSNYMPTRVSVTGSATAAIHLRSGIPYLLIAGARGYGAFTSASLYLVEVTQNFFAYVLKVCDATSYPPITSVTIDRSTRLLTVTFTDSSNYQICLIPLGE